MLRLPYVHLTAGARHFIHNVCLFLDGEGVLEFRTCELDLPTKGEIMEAMYLENL